MKPLRRALSAIRWAANALATTVGGFFNSYPSLDQSRKEIFNGFRPRNATANQILGPTLTTLTAQCRHIERFTPLARAAVEGLVADIVGSGISVLPDSGDDALDAEILDAFYEWAEHACVDGCSLWAWQRTVPRDMATASGALARWVSLPERAQEGRIPLALLPLESEWLSDYPIAPVPANHRFVKGIVADSLGRPVSFHLRNPDRLFGDQGEVVPASEMLYVFEKRRAQQLHGEPLLAAVVERCIQDARLIENELKAAVATSAPALFIGSTGGGLDNTEVDDDGEDVEDIPAGAVIRGRPGESVTSIENNRPTQNIGIFRAEIHGDVSAATRCSRQHLTRDFSRTTFMNTRMEQMLNKRATAGLKETVGEGASGKVYVKLFPWLMLQLGRALPGNRSEQARMARYLLRPDGFEYVDPTKDVQASVNAIAANLSSYDIELSLRGKDFRQVFEQRALENKLLEKLGLPVAQPQKLSGIAPAEAPEEDGKDEAEDEAEPKEEAA